jgi:hypothetical protein
VRWWSIAQTAANSEWLSWIPSGQHGIILNPADHHFARQSLGGLSFRAGAGHRFRPCEQPKQADPSFSADQVVGIGIDATGSSPIPVDANNVPLESNPAFAGNPNAFCWLWKDHTSIPEAAVITEIASRLRPPYLAKIGGTYSSEWFWAKIWHCLNVDPVCFSGRVFVGLNLQTFCQPCSLAFRIRDKSSAAFAWLDTKPSTPRIGEGSLTRNSWKPSTLNSQRFVIVFTIRPTTPHPSLAASVAHGRPNSDCLKES